jgi:nucleotide-binding universal stress UspA family protein
MYHTILVPLDGSKRAEVILPHVESLALHYGAKVIFLGVVEPLFIGNTSIYSNPLFDQQNLRYQTQIMSEYLTTHQKDFESKGIEASQKVGHGSIVAEILKIAQLEQVDLLAMSSHGRSGLSRVFYGSVAAGVLHQIDRPLLLIRSLK